MILERFPPITLGERVVAFVKHYHGAFLVELWETAQGGASGSCFVDIHRLVDGKWSKRVVNQLRWVPASGWARREEAYATCDQLFEEAQADPYTIYASAQPRKRTGEKRQDYTEWGYWVD